MANFGNLEFVLDRYSGTWCWKISGSRAVNMVAKLIPRAWYGDKPDEAIVKERITLYLPIQETFHNYNS